MFRLNKLKMFSFSLLISSFKFCNRSQLCLNTVVSKISGSAMLTVEVSGY